MQLENVCNSGTWVEVDFGWLGLELLPLALLAIAVWYFIFSRHKRHSAR